MSSDSKPVVVGSYPADGAVLHPSAHHDDFCIALAFSAAVQGVSSESVSAAATWESDDPDQLPLEWRPASGSCCSTVWLGYLPLNQKVLPGSQVTVKVNHTGPAAVRLWGATENAAKPYAFQFSVATRQQAVQEEHGAAAESLDTANTLARPKSVLTPDGALAANVHVQLEPMHLQSIHLQFGAPVQLSEVAVTVGGIERIGVWSAVEGSTSGWKFECVTPPLAHDQLEAGLALKVGSGGLVLNGDEISAIATQQLMVAAGSEEAPDTDSFAAIVLAEVHCCRELLELEPRTKWPQLTLASLMVLAGWAVRHVEPVLQNLTEDDPKRARYYTDFASQLRVREQLELHPLGSSLDLSNLRLTTMITNTSLCRLLSLNLSHNCLQTTEAITGSVLPMIESLDLRSNQLKKISGGSISSLQRLAELFLDSNDLESVEGLQGSRLRLLSLAQNQRLQVSAEDIVTMLHGQSREEDEPVLQVTGLDTGFVRLGNWVLSSELGSGDLDQIKSLISQNGLSCEETTQNPAATVVAGPAMSGPMSNEQQAEADAAFARMVAANPSATVIGVAPVTEEQQTGADAAFAQMVAANPAATVIGGAPAEQEKEGVMRVGNWVFSSKLCGGDLDQIKSLISLNGLSCDETLAAPSKTAADKEAADAAFARLVAANPNAKVIN